MSKTGDITYLNLDFLVPTMYFFNNQTIEGEMYDRAITISFNDRTNFPLVYNACFSNRIGDTNCPQVLSPWSNVDDTDDACLQVVSGQLEWSKMMTENWHDITRRDVRTG